MVFKEGNKILHSSLVSYIFLFGWSPKGQFLYDGTHYILSPEFQNSDFELIVTIHGIDGFSYVFDNFHSEVLKRNNIDNKRKYRVLQYDLIGRGHSGPSDNKRYGEKEHIDQLRNLITGLGFGKPSKYHVVGISMGGALAALYCEKYHIEVKSLPLLAPAGLMNLPELEYLRAIPWFAWLLKYPLQWSELQPANSKTFYDKTGIFEERFNYMMNMKRLAYDKNPHQLDATFQSKMEFPVYGIDNNVVALGIIENFPIQVIFGKIVMTSVYFIFSTFYF